MTALLHMPGKVSRYSRLTDAEVIERCQRRDQRASTELFRRYKPFIASLIKKYGFNSMDTEDLLQESYCRIWKGLPHLRRTEAFKPWVRIIVNNLFNDFLRSKQRQLPIVSIDSLQEDDGSDTYTPELPDLRPGPAEACERKEENAKLLMALSSIPDKFRTTFVLREMEDMTYEEISQATKVDLGTVKSRIHRAKRKLSEFWTSAA